jgi:hypothetical protein
MQLDNSDIIPARACLSENLVCEALRHTVTNAFHRTTSSERVRVVCPEPRRDELDGLVLELIVVHECLVCEYTARSSVLCGGQSAYRGGARTLLRNGCWATHVLGELIRDLLRSKDRSLVVARTKLRIWVVDRMFMVLRR